MMASVVWWCGVCGVVWCGVVYYNVGLGEKRAQGNGVDFSF